MSEVIQLRRFVGEKVALARHFRGLTQSELADLVAVTPGRIGQVEKGAVPSQTLLEALGAVLGFEPEFFTEGVPDQFTEENCYFRRQASATAKSRKRLLALGTLTAIIVRYLRTRLKLPEFNVPHVPVKSLGDIEEAAEECRIQWGLGLDTPIMNLSRATERAGVVIVKLDANAERIDAFSRYGDMSMIMLNTTKGSPSRTRFDLAHELGHLVMHRDNSTATHDREMEAHRFAGALLLPRQGFPAEFMAMRTWSWDYLFSLKRRWGVSVAAIVRRAYDLGLIDAAQYQRAYKYIHARGWHKGEPIEGEMERPELLAAAIAKLEQHYGETPYQVARRLSWKPETFEEVTGIPAPPPMDGVFSFSKYRQRMGLAGGDGGRT